MPVNVRDEEESYVIIGRISGLYGVKGWHKIYSHTRPRKNILKYRPWFIRQGSDWIARDLQEGRSQGKGVVAKLAGCDDRDQAALLLERDIAVKRTQLPKPEKGSYYWADLEGLTVISREGVELGRVDYLFETGSNDVLVVKGERERLIPFIADQVVIEVDLEQGRIRVDWDPDF